MERMSCRNVALFLCSFEFHGKYEMEDATVTSVSARNFRKAGFVPMFATTMSDGTFSTWEFVYDEDCSGKGFILVINYVRYF